MAEAEFHAVPDLQPRAEGPLPDRGACRNVPRRPLSTITPESHARVVGLACVALGLGKSNPTSLLGTRGLFGVSVKRG